MAMEIRNAGYPDLSTILAIYNDAVVNTTAVYDSTPRTPEGQERWFKAKQDSALPVLVAEESGQVMGFASYGQFRPWPGFAHTVENSIYVAPDSRGRGVGTVLLGSLIGIARENGLHAMVAGIDADNAASLRLHAKFGFESIGRLREVGWKFGRWLDLVFLQRLLVG